MRRHTNTRKQGDKQPQIARNASTTDSTDTTVEEMSEKEFRKFTVKMFYKLKEDVSSEIRKYKK